MNQERQPELEFKLRAAIAIRAEALVDALRDSGFELAPMSSGQHRDVYLDDDRQCLLRRGIGLRLRRSEDDGVLCYKRRGKREGALHVRTEIEAPWQGTALPSCAQALPERLRDAIEPFSLDRPLRPMVELHVERERLALAHGGTSIGEFAVDRVTADVNGRSTSFFEIELEVHADLPACHRAIEQVLAILPVEPAIDDKLTHSLRVLALLPEPHDDDTPPRTLGTLLAVVLRRSYEALRQHEAAVRGSGAPTDVHALRVSLRRLRVLFGAFRSLFHPEALVRAKQAVISLHRACAEVRACDVQLQRLPRLLNRVPSALRAEMDRLTDMLGRTREGALASVREHLRGESHLQELAQLGILCEGGEFEPSESALPAASAAIARRRAARHVRKLLRELGEDPPINQVHELRLATKRLRILCQELAPTVPSLGNRARGRVDQALVKMGALCDHTAEVDRLLLLIEPPSAEPARPRAAALFGSLATLSHASYQDAGKAARKACARLDRRWLWRELGPRQL